MSDFAAQGPDNHPSERPPILQDRLREQAILSVRERSADEDDELFREAADEIDRLTTRATALENGLRELREVCRFGTFDNGVSAANGTKEAEYWAGMALHTADTLLGLKP